MLKCPDCTASLRAMRTEGVTVDRCDACGGVWFDEAELGRLRDNLQGRDGRSPALSSTTTGAPATVSKPQCPRCDVSLRSGEYGYGTGVRVGRCGGCEGIWLAGAQVASFLENLRTATAKREETREAAEDIARNVEAQVEGERVEKGYGGYHRHRSHYDASDWALELLEYFPLRLESEGRGAPYVTVTLIVASAVTVWFFPQSLVNTLSFVPARLFEGKGFASVFASGVVYDSDLRFWLDAFFFYVFGTGLEVRLGSLRFLAVCFLAHVAGAVATAVVGGDHVLYAGGAAAVAASVMAYMMIYPSGRIQMTEAEEPLTVPALFIAAAFPPLYWFLGPGGAAWWSVPAGLVIGAVLGGLWSRREP